MHYDQSNILYLATLHMLKEHLQILTLLTIITNNGTSTSNDLLGITILVNLAKTNPFTKFFGISNLDEGDFMLSTQGFNQSNVFLLFAAFSQHAEMGITTIEDLDGLTESTGKTVVDEGATEDFAEGGLHGDHTGGFGGGYFDNYISV